MTHGSARAFDLARMFEQKGKERNDCIKKEVVITGDVFEAGGTYRESINARTIEISIKKDDEYHVRKGIHEYIVDNYDQYTVYLTSRPEEGKLRADLRTPYLKRTYQKGLPL